MNKVGICACYNTLNYGSMLQCFATQYVIDELGFDSEIIVYKKKKNLNFYVKSIPRLFNWSLLSDKLQKIQKIIALSFYTQIRYKDTVRNDAFKRFQNLYYRKLSQPYNGFQELCKGAKNYQSIVVGSDQLWLPAGLATNFYNLNFVPDSINKISYATSFGVKKIPWHQKKRTKEYLERINYLSVREIQGAKIIEELINKKSYIALDPTMLLTKKEWEAVIPVKRIYKDEYIFCYFLGTNPKHRDLAKELQKEVGLKIITLPFLDSFVRKDINFGDEQLFDISPEDFVNLIRNATYILTDSFHGSVFSIINRKQFVIFNRFDENSKNSRNSRIDSLCTSLGLKSRRYKEDIFLTITKKINYDLVESRLNELRNESINFLKKALGNK